MPPRESQDSQVDERISDGVRVYDRPRSADLPRGWMVGLIVFVLLLAAAVICAVMMT